MGFLEKVSKKLVTKYGKVTEGEYSGCEVAFGGDSSKKIAIGNSAMEQIIFMSGEEEKGRLRIKDDIAELKYIGDTADVLKVELIFTNQKSSLIDVYITRNNDSAGGVAKAFSVLNKANKFIDEASNKSQFDNDEARKKYHYVFNFLNFLIDVHTEQSAMKGFYEFMQKNGMDKITMNTVPIYKPLMDYYESLLKI